MTNTCCNIEIRLNGHRLSASLIPQGGARTSDIFYVYLLKNGAVHTRGESWVQNTEFHWEVSESGLYSVQGHLKRDGINTVSFSSPVLFLSEEDESEFNNYIKAPLVTTASPIEEDVFQSSYPYLDFLLVSWSGAREILEPARHFASQFQLECRPSAEGQKNSCVIASSGHLKGSGHRPYIFSGSCFLEGKLVFGDRDLTDIDTIIHEEPLGNYTYISSNRAETAFSCGADYFGIGKLYYLQGDGIAVVSNNYHLLLLLARALGEPLEVNLEKAAATLVFATIQPFHQNFTRQMDIRSVCMLPADKKIHVSDGVICLEDTTLALSLSQPQPFDAATYERLLRQAKDEILDNVRAVLEHPAFDHVISDLSGGMDSRLVFCALSHFPEYAQKVRINSQYSAADPDDLIVAQEIASLYDYAFDDLPRNQFYMPGKTMASAYWSYNLGAYYSYMPSPRGARIPGAARINGFYGEICARPYYSRRMHGTELDVSTVDEFCDRYFAWHRKSAISSSDSGIDSLRQLFSEELKAIPGRTPLEKFDNHYMFFRNGLHCSDRLRSYASCPEFGPIQSKSLSAAKAMGYQVFRGAKVQFDIINLLNPAIASLRYESPFDNDDRNAVRERFGILGEPWSSGLRLTPGNVVDKWSAAKDRILYRDVETDPAERSKFAEGYRTFETDHFRMALDLLKGLRHGGVIGSEELVRSIWFMFTRSGDKAISRATRWNIVNRLASLHAQMQIAKSMDKKASQSTPRI